MQLIRTNILVLAAVFLAAVIFAPETFGQSDNPPVIRIPSVDDKKDPESTSIQEMTVKQEISRRKKEHEEMLRHGEEALKLSEALANSTEGKERFSSQDLQKLEDLEKVVAKIREELGGKNDDDNDDETSSDGSENAARKSFGSAFKFLRSSTVKLVDELKKSTRFSISVAAIQASNSVIKFARLLRLKK